jgi:hypothetical protein
MSFRGSAGCDFLPEVAMTLSQTKVLFALPLVTLGIWLFGVVGRSGDRRLRVPTSRRFGPGLLSSLDRDLLLGLLLLGLYLLAGGIEYRALEALR